MSDSGSVVVEKKKKRKKSKSSKRRGGDEDDLRRERDDSGEEEPSDADSVQSDEDASEEDEDGSEEMKDFLVEEDVADAGFHRRFRGEGPGGDFDVESDLDSEEEERNLDDQELDQDDYDLIKEAGGALPRAQGRLKRNEDSELSFDDEPDEHPEHDIVDDEPHDYRVPRRSGVRLKGRQREELQEMFGDESIEDVLRIIASTGREAEDEEEPHPHSQPQRMDSEEDHFETAQVKKKQTMIQLGEHEEIKREFLTDQDETIKKADVPERLFTSQRTRVERNEVGEMKEQEGKVGEDEVGESQNKGEWKVKMAEPKDLEIEARWVLSRLVAEAHQVAEGMNGSVPGRWATVQTDTDLTPEYQAVKQVLYLLLRDRLEVPHIIWHKSYLVCPPLDEDIIWRIKDLDGEWWSCAEQFERLRKRIEEIKKSAPRGTQESELVPEQIRNAIDEKSPIFASKDELLRISRHLDFFYPPWVLAEEQWKRRSEGGYIDDIVDDLEGPSQDQLKKSEGDVDVEMAPADEEGGGDLFAESNGNAEEPSGLSSIVPPRAAPVANLKQEEMSGQQVFDESQTEAAIQKAAKNFRVPEKVRFVWKNKLDRRWRSKKVVISPDLLHEFYKCNIGPSHRDLHVIEDAETGVAIEPDRWLAETVGAGVIEQSSKIREYMILYEAVRLHSYFPLRRQIEEELRDQIRISSELTDLGYASRARREPVDPLYRALLVRDYPVAFFTRDPVALHTLVLTHCEGNVQELVRRARGVGQKGFEFGWDDLMALPVFDKNAYLAGCSDALFHQFDEIVKKEEKKKEGEGPDEQEQQEQQQQQQQQDEESKKKERVPLVAETPFVEHDLLPSKWDTPLFLGGRSKEAEKEEGDEIESGKGLGKWLRDVVQDLEEKREKKRKAEVKRLDAENLVAEDSWLFLAMHKAEKENLIEIKVTLPPEAEKYILKRLERAYCAKREAGDDSSDAWNQMRREIVKRFLSRTFKEYVEEIKRELLKKAQDAVATACRKQLHIRLDMQPYKKDLQCPTPEDEPLLSHMSLEQVNELARSALTKGGRRGAAKRVKKKSGDSDDEDDSDNERDTEEALEWEKSDDEDEGQRRDEHAREDEVIYDECAPGPHLARIPGRYRVMSLVMEELSGGPRVHCVALSRMGETEQPQDLSLNYLLQEPPQKKQQEKKAPLVETRAESAQPAQQAGGDGNPQDGTAAVEQEEEEEDEENSRHSKDRAQLMDFIRSRRPEVIVIGPGNKAPKLKVMLEALVEDWQRESELQRQIDELGEKSGKTSDESKKTKMIALQLVLKAKLVNRRPFVGQLSTEVPRILARSHVVRGGALGRSMKGLASSTIEAIALGRFVQDPLSTTLSLWGDLDSNDLLHMHLHPLQNQVDKKVLENALLRAIQMVVAKAGVDINAAKNHYHLQSSVRFLPGLGPRKASYLLSGLIHTGSEVQGRSELTQLLPGQYVYTNCYPFVIIRVAPGAEGISEPLDRVRLSMEQHGLGQRIAKLQTRAWRQRDFWLERGRRQYVRRFHQASQNVHSMQGDVDNSDAVLMLEMPQMLDAIDLDAFAESYSKKQQGHVGDPKNFIVFLRFMFDEFFMPYLDHRCPFSWSTAKEQFFADFGESPAEFRVGAVLLGRLKPQIGLRLKLQADAEEKNKEKDPHADDGKDLYQAGTAFFELESSARVGVKVFDMDYAKHQWAEEMGLKTIGMARRKFQAEPLPLLLVNVQFEPHRRFPFVGSICTETAADEFFWKKLAPRFPLETRWLALLLQPPDSQVLFAQRWVNQVVDLISVFKDQFAPPKRRQPLKRQRNEEGVKNKQKSIAPSGFMSVERVREREAQGGGSKRVRRLGEEGEAASGAPSTNRDAAASSSSSSSSRPALQRPEIRRRPIDHPNFRNEDKETLTEQLKRPEYPVGEYFICPSKKSNLLYLLVKAREPQLLEEEGDVEERQGGASLVSHDKDPFVWVGEIDEEDQEREGTLGRVLMLEGSKFFSLDQLVGTYVSNFTGNLQALCAHKKFTKAQYQLASEALRIERTNNPAHVAYKICRPPAGDKYYEPNCFFLISCGTEKDGRLKVEEELIEVTKDHFRLWVKECSTIEQLIRHFKLNYNNRKRFRADERQYVLRRKQSDKEEKAERRRQTEKNANIARARAAAEQQEGPPPGFAPGPAVPGPGGVPLPMMAAGGVAAAGGVPGLPGGLASNFVSTGAANQGGQLQGGGTGFQLPQQPALGSGGFGGFVSSSYNYDRDRAAQIQQMDQGRGRSGGFGGAPWRG